MQREGGWRVNLSLQINQIVGKKRAEKYGEKGFFQQQKSEKKRSENK